jgi:hypothetical protein
MIPRDFRLALLGLLLASLTGSVSAQAKVSANHVREEASASPEAAGDHLRLVTKRGVVHVWRPSDYQARTAGIVVYVHGYFTDADQAWTEGQLAAQFQASGRNALFIVPEAPQSLAEGVRWKSLRGLLDAIQRTAALRLPRGPLVVVGHSGAFRTILNWLRDPRVRFLILLDGLYRNERQFRYWLQYAPAHRSHQMVLVANETHEKSDRFARRFRGAARRERIPEDFSEFTKLERGARLLYLRSQYEHMEIVTGGKVLPLFLKLTPLESLPVAQEPGGARSSKTDPSR